MLTTHYNSNNIDYKKLYTQIRTNHTLDFDSYLRQKYLRFDKAINLLSAVDMAKQVDGVDTYVLAELIRKNGLPEWMQFVALIHNLGNIIHNWGRDKDGTTCKDPWSLTGDTFILGCKIPDTCVYPELNDFNPDMKDNMYNTELGIYRKGCGISHTAVSFNQSEYLYHLLLFNKVKLPEEALYLIRYQSLAPHIDFNSYNELLDDYDREMLPILNTFNNYKFFVQNCFNKNKMDTNIEKVQMYYSELCKKFIQTEYDILYF